MKKFISVFLSLMLFSSSAFAYGKTGYDDIAEYKSKYRILYGLILVVGGGILAYDGFRTIKIDISKPAVDFTARGKWDYKQKIPPYGIERLLWGEGTLRNIGNVTLHNITFQVRYKSQSPDEYYDGSPGGYYARIEKSEGVLVDILPTSIIGQTNNWKHYVETTNSEAGLNEPIGIRDKWYPDSDPSTEPVEIVNVKYTWDKKYKEEMNNIYEGIAGVLLAAGGIYLLVDYIISLKRFDYYMKEKNINIYVENSYDEFSFKVCKRI